MKTNKNLLMLSPYCSWRLSSAYGRYWLALCVAHLSPSISTANYGAR